MSASDYSHLILVLIKANFPGLPYIKGLRICEIQSTSISSQSEARGSPQDELVLPLRRQQITILHLLPYLI